MSVATFWTLAAAAYAVWTALLMWFAAKRQMGAFGLVLLAALIALIAIYLVGMDAAEQDSDGTTLFGLILLLVMVGRWMAASVVLGLITWAVSALLEHIKIRRRNKAEGII